MAHEASEHMAAQRARIFAAWNLGMSWQFWWQRRRRMTPREHGQLATQLVHGLGYASEPR